MNFQQIQDEVLSNRFDPGQRPNAKNWINYRYGRLWGMANWTFKYQITSLAVSGNATSISKGSVGDILRIWDQTVGPSYSGIQSLRPEDMWDIARSTTAGSPGDFTVVGNTIYFERPMDQNRSFWVLSMIPFTALVDDTNTPLIPAEFHEVIVSGATSHGLRLENDPAWSSFEQDWNQGIEDMKSASLTQQRIATDIYPDWP